MSNPLDPNQAQQPDAVIPAATVSPTASEGAIASAAPAAPAAPVTPEQQYPAASPYPTQAPPAYSAPLPPAAPAYPAAAPGTPGYPAAPAYAAAPTAPRTNTMSIISMISSLVGWFSFGVLCVVGVILGHISLKQIKNNGESGRGMALTGVIVGYIGIAGWILGLILVFLVLGIAGASIAAAGAGASTELYS